MVRTISKTRRRKNYPSHLAFSSPPIHCRIKQCKETQDACKAIFLCTTTPVGSGPYWRWPLLGAAPGRAQPGNMCSPGREIFVPKPCSGATDRNREP